MASYARCAFNWPFTAVRGSAKKALNRRGLGPAIETSKLSPCLRPQQMPMSSAEGRHGAAVLAFARLRRVRLSQNAAHGVTRNQKFFVRRNDPGVKWRPLGADAALSSHGLLVLTRIYCQAQTRALIAGECSPIPPVNTTASAPPIEARKAPMYFRAR